jgi:hypothetical protein
MKQDATSPLPPSKGDFNSRACPDFSGGLRDVLQRKTPKRNKIYG